MTPRSNKSSSSSTSWSDVLKVQDFREGEYVDRELVLVKVAVDSKSRAEVMQITDIFRAKIVDVQPKSLTIEDHRQRKQSGKISRTDENLRRARSDAHGQSGFAAKVIMLCSFTLNPQLKTEKPCLQKFIRTKTRT